MLRDVRYALRLLVRNPGFAACAILSMACGIAACTSLLSLVYTLLFRPLAVPRADDVVSIYGVSKAKGAFRTGLSIPDYQDLATRSDLFDGIGAYLRMPIVVDSGEDTERVITELCTGNYHAVLGLRPALGRLFTLEDDRPGAPAVTVLSHQFWRQRFNASPDVIGQRVRINGTMFEIVGVAPASFAGVLLDWYGPPSLWLPFAQLGVVNTRLAGLQPETHREHAWMQVTARLRTGVTAAAANAALQTQAGHLSRAYPSTNEDVSFTAMPTSHARFWPGRRGMVMDFGAMVLAAVGVLLLIAVMNVANLLLARLFTRQSEIAVRLAIGAARAALARQLLIEAMVLSAVSTLASVPLTFVLLRAISKLDLPFFVATGSLDLSPDWRIFGIVAGLCVGCGLLLGLAPAWHAWRSDVRSGLTTTPSSARVTMLGTWDLRFTLAALQVAVCLVLALAAGLLGKSLVGLARVDLGFNPDRVTLFGVETFALGYTKTENAAFNRDLLARVRRVPGVEAASWAFHALPSPSGGRKTIAVAEARDRSTNVQLSARFNVVSEGYFETMRIPLAGGRAFEVGDTEAESSRAAILNETAAQRLWGSPAHALGQRIHVRDESGYERTREVVGVVRDAIYGEPGEAPMPYLFEPMDRSWDGAVVLHVLGPRELAPLVRQVKRELRSIDQSLALSEASTLDQQVASRIAAPSLAARLAMLASALGVGLALLGLYSVLMWLVAQRRTELAIRMSIGATPRQIVMSVAVFGLKITLAGAAIGLVGSYFGLRLIATQLRGVDIHDPLVYASVLALVLVAALGACLLPARHAARLDPWGVLRG